MKFLSALSVIILSAQALPTYVNYNATRADQECTGFATVGDGIFGGEGGPTWTVHDPWAFRDAVTGNSPRVIYVRGRMDLSVFFVGSPGIYLRIGSYKTILGGDSTAEITGGSLYISNRTQVIVRDLILTNALAYAPGESPDGNGFIANPVGGEFTEVDAVGINGSTHIWVDHNEFSDDPWISHVIPNEEMRHDGLVDITHGSSYITVSNNILRNHNKVMLFGNHDANYHIDMNRLKVTVLLNWFQGTTQRNPRIRYGEVHVLNNLYTGILSYGIGVGAGASVIAEKNVFYDTRRAWRHPSGTPNPMGNLLDLGNLLHPGSRFDDVPNNVTWHPTDYYQYKALPVEQVEDYVRLNAGVSRK